MSRRPLFLERSSYRRRRLGDAARILPVVALLLLVLPVWWFPEQVSLTGGALWLFGLWATLIVLIAALHLALGRADHAAQQAEAQGQGPDDEMRSDAGGQDWDAPSDLTSSGDDEARDAR